MTSTATSVKINPVFSASGINYYAQSDDVLDAGVKTVTVVSTLNNSPSITSQSLFYVIMIDPCHSTVISTTPTTVENLVQFAGYTTQSKSLYSFGDNVSLSITVVPDLCGEKLLDFKLNGTSTTFISSKNSDYISFSPPADTKSFGEA